MSPTASIALYRHPLSGHAHRVELALSLLGLAYQAIDVDLMKGEHKTPEFLRRNPFGQVPVLDDNGTVVFDSNAILIYLAAKYDTQGRWMPRDPRGQAEVQVWLSVAAGQIAYGPAAARLVTLFGAKFNHREVIARANALLDVMDKHLASHAWLAAERPSLADIAGYSYLAVAPEGDVDLQPHAHVRAWLERVEALPNFVPMAKTPATAAA